MRILEKRLDCPYELTKNQPKICKKQPVVPQVTGYFFADSKVLRHLPGVGDTLKK
jgi:hypothetical protein